MTRITATITHEIAIVPDSPQPARGRHDDVLAVARALAVERQVDAWLSEDLRHFVRIARCRHLPGVPDEHLVRSA